MYFVWRVKHPKPAEKGGVAPGAAEVARWEAEEASNGREEVDPLRLLGDPSKH